MIKGFWLWLSCWRRGHGSRSFGRGVGRGEEVDLLGDCSSKIVEGFAKVGRVVVGFIRVLGGDLKHLLVDLLERIDSLLEFDIVWWELGLLQGCQQLVIAR